MLVNSEPEAIQTTDQRKPCFDNNFHSLTAGGNRLTTNLFKTFKKFILPIRITCRHTQRPGKGTL